MIEQAPNLSDQIHRCVRPELQELHQKIEETRSQIIDLNTSKTEKIELRDQWWDLIIYYVKLQKELEESDKCFEEYWTEHNTLSDMRDVHQKAADHYAEQLSRLESGDPELIEGIKS